MFIFVVVYIVDYFIKFLHGLDQWCTDYGSWFGHCQGVSWEIFGGSFTVLWVFDVLSGIQWDISEKIILVGK